MSLTMLAVMISPLYLKLVLDPKGSHKAMKEVSKSPGLLMIFFFFYAILAALILSNTGLNFSWEWESLLAWLGLLIFIKGVFVLIPGWIELWMKKFNEKHFPMFGFIGLLFMLFLVYVDVKLLA